LAAFEVDLRSDTVTRPTEAMRRAMAAAPVGDDQFGEDPSINALQERCAALLGKAAALWTPTGTMANQIALRVLTRPGDDVIVSRQSHAVWHEAGASAANAGVQFTEIGDRGTFTAAEFLAARKPRGHPLYPPTSLVEIENTHNRSGGIIVPQGEVVRICQAARDHGVASYLDGSRLWNAGVATGVPVSTLAAPFDAVSVAFSKGLGAPAGSVLAGPRDVVERAVRSRRMLGGAMRQVGILAAAAVHALDYHVDTPASSRSGWLRAGDSRSISPRFRPTS
jgi:threonine aldolase